MKYQKLSLVMPVYNEEQTLAQIVQKILQINWPLTIEIIMVNDGSSDNSRQIMQQLSADKRVRIFDNPKNIGKTQTVKFAISQSTGDLVVIQDADLEYEPNDLLQMLDLFEASNLDIIYGNRFGKKNKIIYLSNWLGNRSLSFFSSLFTGLRSQMWTSDMETCYKMINGDVIRQIAPQIISTSSFGFEPEITARLSKYKKNGKHLKFKQIPIHYYPRTIAEGKKMKGIVDGFKALKEIIKFNLSNR